MAKSLSVLRNRYQVLARAADPHAFPIAGKVIEIAGGMVPLPNQMPEVFAETVLAFLAREYPAQ